MLKPVIAMFLLTFVVWLVMYFQRFRYMVATKIEPQSIATPETISELLPERVNRPSDNLKNLFELPVLFYSACGISIALQVSDNMLIIMAWSFVLLRTLHSAIHCTVNHVMARFVAYLLSSIVLFVMLVRIAILAT